MYDRKYFHRKHLIKSSKGFWVHCDMCNSEVTKYSCGGARGWNPSIQEEGGGKISGSSSQLCMEFTEVSLCQIITNKKNSVNGVSLS